MSDLYKKYVENQTPAEIRVRVSNAISNGEISGNELLNFITELDNNGKLNNADINISPKDTWNENYLLSLTNQAVRGVFSKKYLKHLSQVSEYLQKKRRKNHFIKLLMLIVLIGAIISGIIGFKNWLTHKKDNTQISSQTTVYSQERIR